MSSSQSNLSNSQYGYDMVVAVTQASVNATMEEWLSKYEGSLFTQAYVYNPEHPPEQTGATITDFERLKAVVGFDPFTIPNGTPMNDERIKKLIDQKFMFAFQAEIGLPDFPLDKIPPVIQFDKEGSYVTYNMSCKVFRIISIEAEGMYAYNWVNLSQDGADAPWTFNFTVDLDLRNDNINNHFHNLPPATQNEIKNLGEDMFSVQQLYLDLNAAGLTSNPEIKGLSTSSTAYIILIKIFINNYLAAISKDGGILLGYSVVSQQPFPKNVSLIPTNLNFEISAYKDSKGIATADYSAYTLNYLIMSKGKPMPAPVPFAWNWVEKDQTSQYAGVTSVNRDVFVTFLHDLLSPSLENIAKIPKTSFSINCIQASFSWSYDTDTSAQTFNTVQNGGSHVLTYSYSKNASADDGQYCGIYYNWGNFGLNYSVQSDVYLEGTSIQVETTINMRVHLNVEGGVTEGNYARKKSVTVYTIGVDAYGQISVSQSGPTITDESEGVDPNWWAKFVTLGQITDTVNKIKSTLQNWIEGFLVNEANEIAWMLNGSSGWVFPGGKTFTFKNAAFSDKQDLVANILYIAPDVK